MKMSCEVDKVEIWKNEWVSYYVEYKKEGILLSRVERYYGGKEERRMFLSWKRLDEIVRGSCVR